MDADLETLTRDELMAEVKKLRQGVRVHRDSTGHDLCWHHPALWSLLPEKTDPVPEVPPWPEFLRGCIRYRQSLAEQLPHAQAASGAHAQPGDLVRAWVEVFNRADVEALAAFYSEGATNHPVAEAPVTGRAAIRDMFAQGFAGAKMVCIIEQIFEDGDWAILEWRDPLGLRGCGFFHVVGGKIVFQRGYWDKLTFLRLQGLPRA